jgi:hypothetical protein
MTATLRHAYELVPGGGTRYWYPSSSCVGDVVRYSARSTAVELSRCAACGGDVGPHHLIVTPCAVSVQIILAHSVCGRLARRTSQRTRAQTSARLLACWPALVVVESLRAYVSGLCVVKAHNARMHAHVAHMHTSQHRKFRMYKYSRLKVIIAPTPRSLVNMNST